MPDSVTAVAAMPAKQMMALRAESRSLIHESNDLQQIRTAGEYEECSDIRARAKAFKANVDKKFAPIIDPLLTALNATYALRKEVTEPILEVDRRITGMMRDFKTEELQRERAEEARRREEAEKLRREAEAKRIAESEAITIPMRQHLNKAAEVLDAKADKVEAAPLAARIRATSSGTRVVKKWRVPDLGKLLAAVAAGDVPQDVIMINAAAMNEYFRYDQATVAGFPGVEVYEDIGIFNR